MINGVDYSYSRPSLADLVSHGAQFVGRYVSGGVSNKDLTKVEAQGLLLAGLSIITFGESTAERALGGMSAGMADAIAFREQATAAGQPLSRPIFYTVDFQPTLDEFGLVEDYFRGIAAREKAGSVGVYGSYNVCKALHDLGIVQYMCQTVAWSAGQWFAPAQVQQYEVNQSWNTGSVDLLRANVTDYGQWPYLLTTATPNQENPMGLTAGTFTAGRRQHTIPVTVGVSSATQADAWLRLRTAFGDIDQVLVVFETDTAAVMGTEQIPKISGNTSWVQQIPSGTTGVNISWASETPAVDAQDGLVSVGWSIEYQAK